MEELGFLRMRLTFRDVVVAAPEDADDDNGDDDDGKGGDNGDNEVEVGEEVHDPLLKLVGPAHVSLAVPTKLPRGRQGAWGGAF